MLPIITVFDLLLLAYLCGAIPNVVGTWEIGALGADREVTVNQKDNKIVVHRVMWPEFEGQKYKLEHLYRGTITATQIKGQLLVREEGQTAYEILRPFVGTLTDDSLVIDGMPLKKLDTAEVATIEAPTGAGRTSDAPASP